MKSKKEYMRDYHTNHPECWIYFILSFLFNIMGAIVVIVNGIQLANNISSSKQTEFFFFLIIGMCCWIVGLIFTKLFQSCDRKGVIEYERYCASFEAEQRIGR